MAHDPVKIYIITSICVILFLSYLLMKKPVKETKEGLSLCAGPGLRREVNLGPVPIQAFVSKYNEQDKLPKIDYNRPRCSDV